LDFKNIFETNAMYPMSDSLSFAEHFFFPSFLIMLMSFFIRNSLAQFNLFYVLNHILVFFTFYLFISTVTRKFWGRILSSFYITFGPYFFTQLGHAQMLIIWPLFLALYFLQIYFRERKTKYLIIVGILIGLQFLSAVYLGLMSLVILGVWFVISSLREDGLVKIIVNGLIIILFFTLTAFVSIYGYLELKNKYPTKRDTREYIIYSAHVTDYVFPSQNIRSLLYNTKVFKAWSRFDNHAWGEKAAFIGILPLMLSVIALFQAKISKSRLEIRLSASRVILVALILIIVGALFSLGPRLNVNGQYLHIPLPYYFILKFIPLINVMRALARWYFLVSFGIAVLISLGYEKLTRSKSTKFSDLFGFLALLFLIHEFYPKPVETIEREWWTETYEKTKKICENNPGPLLEYPLTYRNADGNIIKDLQYKTSILLASTEHGCRILSGYPGFEPPQYLKLKEEFDNGLSKADGALAYKKGFKYVKINKNAISKVEKESDDFRSAFDRRYKKIYSSDKTDIYSIFP